MKKIVFLLSVFWFSAIHAQFNLKILVNNIATLAHEEIYVAGNFNQWNPADPAYKLKPMGGNRRGIILKDLPKGEYEFKITRGSWQKVETYANGEDRSNRIVQLDADLTIELSVEGWKDNFPDKIIPNTALEQVQIIDTAFVMPQLNRTRRIWVYLPKNYFKDKSKKYPVLYMNDGQNLFNLQTAAFGEWGVDECLDSLEVQLKKEVIVVGVDHGGAYRLEEYAPFPFKDPSDKSNKMIEGKGKAYVDFLVQTLKPYIDKNFRTLTTAQNTFIGGSSMGGLISMYAILTQPTTFGGGVIFSPAFWVNPQIIELAKQTTLQQITRIYLFAGGKESELIQRYTKQMEDVLLSKKVYHLRTVINPMAEHKESSWRAEFDDFMKWWLLGY